MSETAYNFEVKDSKGKSFSLDKYKGKVLLIVNVASKCGYTPQYTGLEALNKKYASQGLVVLGFPCNQFGGQEPAEDSVIQEFCTFTYNTTFPVLAKINVNGKEADPFYGWLKEKAPGVLGSEAIKWNFTKFLISKDGTQVKRFAPQDTPESLEGEIEGLLKK